jgi:class 3 adenylate cyclase
VLRLFSRRPSLRDAVANLETHAIPADLQDRFAHFLEQARPQELFHLNPRYLAEQLRVNERQTLKLLLAGLHEGIVALHWEVRCPMCNAVDHRSTSLEHLHHDAECDNCHSQFAPHLDDEVRITFSLHERIRTLPPEADDPTFRVEVEARLGSVPGLALLVLPDFQRLFPNQRLLPDESLDVTRVALLFTDLAGSTAIYARRGDPRAYHLVRRHFDELFAVTDRNNGTIVKTIGDAILAAFQHPLEALCAGIEMQQAIVALNDQMRLTDDERLILKVGLHAGPCLSVTLNEHPDYFGTTVNIAARVQSLSRGRDIVFTESIRTDQEVQRIVNEQEMESKHVPLRGFDEETLVHRIAV